MALKCCPICKKLFKDTLSVCDKCGHALSEISTMNVDIEIELIEDQLFNLHTALQGKEPDDKIFNRIKELFKVVHHKIDYKPNPKYDDLLFIMTKHMCHNIKDASPSVIAQYFNLINMEYVTEKGYTKCIELIQEAIKDQVYYIRLWFPIYQLLKYAPEIDKKYLESLLEQNNIFGKPKIEEINSCVEEHLQDINYQNELPIV